MASTDVFFSARSARELISHQKQQGGAERSSPQRRDTQQRARGVRNSVASELVSSVVSYGGAAAGEAER